MESLPSVAAQVMITIIPIVGIVAVAVVGLIYVVLQHKQNLKLIEKGLYQRHKVDAQAFALLSSLILLAVGLTLSAFFVVFEGFAWSLLGGIIPLSLGGSLLAYWKLRAGRSGG